jgi:hypothetical protein
VGAWKRMPTKESLVITPTLFTSLRKPGDNSTSIWCVSKVGACTGLLTDVYCCALGRPPLIAWHLQIWHLRGAIGLARPEKRIQSAFARIGLPFALMQ